MNLLQPWEVSDVYAASATSQQLSIKFWAVPDAPADANLGPMTRGQTTSAMLSCTCQKLLR